jgi:hypothetical protein
VARITSPTEGHAEFLDVGTGFHPELTGRENVFMSGAILGMRAAEIRRQFDEIVAFSEVERFLDTHLKHYSSAMQMRSVECPLGCLSEMSSWSSRECSGGQDPQTNEYSRQRSSLSTIQQTPERNQQIFHAHNDCGRR